MGGQDFIGKARRGTAAVAHWGYKMAINRNILFVLLGALLVGVGVLSYALYEEKKEPSGVQINLGPCGLKIQNK